MAESFKTLTTAPQAPFRDEVFIPTEVGVKGALVLTQATQSIPVEGDSPAVRIPWMDADASAGIVKEGYEIAPGNPILYETVVRTAKVAALNMISNEAMYANEESGLLSADSLLRGVVEKADDIFLNNPVGQDDGTTPGLFNLPGAVQGDTVTTVLDPIVNAMAQISTNGGTPSAIIMNHGTWAQLQTLRGPNGMTFISPDVVQAATPMLFGIPVVLNRHAPTGKMFINSIGDIFASCGDIKASNSKDLYFDRDCTAIRATFRFGIGVRHPERFAVVPVSITGGTPTLTAIVQPDETTKTTK